MAEGKFYFVSYLTQAVGEAHPSWVPCETLLAGEHPIAALIRWRNDDREQHPHGGRGVILFALLSWQEITEDEYQQFNGHVG